MNISSIASLLLNLGYKSVKIEVVDANDKQHKLEINCCSPKPIEEKANG